MPGILKGIVLLFLLDVGMLAARKAGKLIEAGPALVAFGILASLANAALGIGLAWVLGMGKGFLYVVVPAAMRQSRIW